MKLEKAKVKVKEIISHKNDFDYAYGARIQRPFSVCHEGLEAIETVLEALDNSISKDKVKEIIINKYSYITSEGNRMFSRDCYENFTKDIIKLVGFKLLEDK